MQSKKPGPFPICRIQDSRGALCWVPHAVYHDGRAHHRKGSLWQWRSCPYGGDMRPAKRAHACCLQHNYEGTHTTARLWYQYRIQLSARFACTAQGRPSDPPGSCHAWRDQLLVWPKRSVPVHMAPSIPAEVPAGLTRLFETALGKARRLMRRVLQLRAADHGQTRPMRQTQEWSVAPLVRPRQYVIKALRFGLRHATAARAPPHSSESCRAESGHVSR